MNHFYFFFRIDARFAQQSYVWLSFYAIEILVGNAKISKAWEAGKRGIQKEYLD